MPRLFNLSLVLWKNWRIIRRKYILSLAEILLPCIFMALLLSLREVIKSKNFEDITTWKECKIEKDFTFIAYAPNNSLENHVMDWLQNTNNVTTKGFLLEDEMVKFLLVNSNYNGGIVFENKSSNSNLDMALKIRLPTSGKEKWNTDRMFPLLQTLQPRDKSSECPQNPDYKETGFLYLQYIITKGIIMHLNKTSENFFNQTTLAMNRHPYPPYNNDPMVLVIQGQLPFILILSFILCAVQIVKDIVQEKELRLKEAMKIMGLDNWIMWLGWFIKYFIFMLISISIMTLFLCVKVGDMGSVVGYTDPAIIFLFLLSYTLATITFCFFLSTLFSKANSGSVAGGVLFFLSYTPYSFIGIRYATLTWGTKVGCCLLSNMALAFGGQVLGIFEGQGVGVQWNNISHGSSVDDDFTFLQVILMLLFDAILYSLLTWYIEAVFPGEYGVPQKWYFPFTKSYWIGTIQTKCLSGTLGTSQEDDRQFFETEPSNLKAGIQIKNLYKAFNNGKKVAVEDLTLNMFEGQITALLGHNGAGKTTTISMITGMIPPSNGTAIVNGYDIRNNIRSVRSSLGICPQHDILFEMLTVKEHLEFFALESTIHQDWSNSMIISFFKDKGDADGRNNYRGIKLLNQLKGFPKEFLDAEVNKMIQSITLEDKRNVLSKSLSGGMKRRLSLGIALIGDSKIIILDEPSSGLDPNARRQIWSVLEKHRMGRTMLLTTHFMDEADHLGDRIAIISDGVLKCSGSSLFLKSKYGAGYHLVIVKSPDCNVVDVSKLLKQYIPEAKMESNVGAELSYLLPHHSSSQFENLFNTIQSEQSSLGILSYGVSVTTMEEVFLKVCQNQNPSTLAECYENTERNNLGSECVVPVPEYSSFKTTMRNCRTKKTGFALILQQFRAMLAKKMIYSWRNKFMSIIQIIVPLLFTIVALVSIKTFPSRNNFPPLLLTPEKYGQNYIPFSSPLNLTKEEENIINLYQDKSLSKNIHFVNINKQRSNITEYLGSISIKDRENYNEQYMISADFGATKPNHYLAYFNDQSFHSSPISLGMMMSAIFKQFLDYSSNIIYINHPLPVSEKGAQSNSFLSPDGFTISVMVLFGVGFTAASFSLFVVKERCTKSKHLQYISGLYPFNFWGSTYIWDLLSFLVISIFLIIAFACLDTKAYIGDTRFLGILLLFFLYAAAILPMVYVMSFIFKTPTSSFVWLALINLIAGILTVLAVNILRIPALDLQDVSDVLFWVFLVIFPQFCLGQGLVDFYTNFELIQFCDKNFFFPTCRADCKENCYPFNKNYLGWEGKGIGKQLVFLFIQNIIFLLLLIFIESSVFEKMVYTLKMLTKKKVQTITIQKSTESIRSLDDDVLKEKERVEKCHEGNDVIVVKNVSKLYNNFLAVNHLSVGISAGECFGLLGINGAGKTTTFKMLTGDERITNGMIYINNVSIKSDIRQIQRYIGYCPQFDALIECMTGREVLKMFALIRGISPDKNTQVVNDLIEELMLQKYADKQVKTYSGGNKRKLSTAVALIGDPPVVLLDEPTTGMDPGTRRNLWNTLIKVRDTGRTLILTSHSMDECEALCTKIAIMVNGQFRCYGSTQHLKSKFGDGYTLIIKVKHESASDIPHNDVPQSLEPLMNFIETSLPGCTLKDMHEGLIHYQIAKNPNISWAQMFGTLENAKNMFNIEAYSLGQTSLEQVFINFARSQITRK